MQTVAAMYPSQYRKYLKLWKEHNVAALHESGFQWLVKHAKRVGGSYKESNGIIYRVYFPIYVEAEIPISIKSRLEYAGYRVDTDSPEYCIDKHGRRVSLNKAYQLSAKKAGVPEKTIKSVMETYAEVFGSAGVMLLCVSRHPYDIAGMSTGRAWQSCHTVGGDGPKEKARKKAKYAKEMAAYKKELAELGLDEQETSAVHDEYRRELEAHRQKTDQLADDIDENAAELARLDSDAYDAVRKLDPIVDEIFDSINAGQRKIIGDSVFKNTGIPEKLAEYVVGGAMLDEYVLGSVIRYNLVVKALPNITPEQREFFDIAERKGPKRRLGARILDTFNSFFSTVTGKVYVDADGEPIYLREGFPETTPAEEYEVDLDRLEDNLPSVEDLYYGCVDDYIKGHNKASVQVRKCIKVLDAKSLANERLKKAKEARADANRYYPVEPNLPVQPKHPDELPEIKPGLYSRLVAEDVITGSVIVYAIKPKLSLLTSIEKAKRVDARIASALNSRLDKSNKDPLFEPLGRVILRTANGKYLRPGDIYGLSYAPTILKQFKKMAKLLSVALNKAIRRDSGGVEPLYHEYNPSVDTTYLEGSDDRFGFATTQPVSLPRHQPTRAAEGKAF